MAGPTFVDEALLHVSSGAGGPGAVHFRREKFEPNGGPDGGDGGRGGDIVLVASRNENTLLSFRARREFNAKSGDPGSGGRRTGADGATIEIRVPIGTMIYEVAEDGSALEGALEPELLVDLAEDGQRFVVARGGRGGKGNTHFKSARRRSPEFAQEGEEGETRHLQLSLKLLADVGLVGFPNAGKSTLIRAISAARPRVASYPFTTLVPSLGVVEVDDRRIVVADIPGLIEGASEGAGLGDQFLRHVERTRVLVHVLDLGAMLLEGRDPRADYQAIRNELGLYRPELLERREIVLFNKTDLIGPDDPKQADLDALEQAFAAEGRRVLRASGATKTGTRELATALVQEIDEVMREHEEREKRAASEQAGEPT